MAAEPNYSFWQNRYAGRSVLVTGGARGLGFAVASRVAAEGATVGLVDLDKDDVTAAATRLTAAGHTAFGFASDVSDSERMSEVVAQFNELAGEIDVLVTMAGIFPFASVESTTDELWQRVVEVNLGGTFQTAKVVFPYMRRRGYGRIVTVSSGTVLLGIPGLAAYSASKAGVIGLTRTLAREGGEHGITVNAVLPGLIATEHTLSMREDVDEFFATVVSGQCVPRRGRPEDVAEAVAFLGSEGAQFVTGQSLHVGGGDRFL